MENISKHISYTEATHSATGEAKGLKNEPSQEILATMKHTAARVFEPLREGIGKPIAIVSFFRSEAVNKAVGGAPNSQHKVGEAMDIKGTGGVTNAQLFTYIKNNLDFDQVIWEFGTDKEPDWVHVSYKRVGKNRKQALRAKKVKGATIYEPIK